MEFPSALLNLVYLITGEKIFAMIDSCSLESISSVPALENSVFAFSVKHATDLAGFDMLLHHPLF